ncbi:MAG TPA: UDP-N-acetylmuramoyl-tripeptide--D-alanyl-D-alanine ligase [Candidatus Cybelea sp.]|jgi:UDP-N-acetylmuramoyl-tripeptide--D-alanyl-D-alanine ligase|nr:UDP-N-acetylmuramoyl-tripeptide--D-alanyl-D-alanine ligase [Candidatus Cybelea sp.]
MNLPIDAAIAATSATLLDGAAAPPSLRMSTDTRTILPGDTFLALRGERFDAHDFVAEAVRRGAGMIVVDRPQARVPGAATMLVRDTQAAYMALAAAARALFHGRVVGITGSTGKTTTKAFLTKVLAEKFGDRIAATHSNENNEIGVSKLLLSASNEEHDVLVIEMGARHFGDVEVLVDIARPEIGILTNVGDAHVEIMGSRERLEATKWALFARGAAAILNASDEVSRRRAPMLAGSPHWFAAEDASSLDLPPSGSSYTVLGKNRLSYRSPTEHVEIDVDVRVPGWHNRANLAAAISAATELGVPLPEIAACIPDLQLPGGRYDRLTLHGIRIIYDAYNANANGMIAALDAFAGEAAARRIAVLASMAELGDESPSLHERVGAHAAARVDMLLVSGEYAADLTRGARRGGLSERQIVQIATNAEAARWLREHVSDDDVVLLKGSRKYKLEEIVEELRT